MSTKCGQLDGCDDRSDLSSVLARSAARGHPRSCRDVSRPPTASVVLAKSAVPRRRRGLCEGLEGGGRRESTGPRQLGRRGVPHLVFRKRHDRDGHSAALGSSESRSADVREGPLGLRVPPRAVLSAAHYVDVDEDGLRPDLEARINPGRATARRDPRRSLTITFREPDANNGNVDVNRLAGHASRVRSPLRQAREITFVSLPVGDRTADHHLRL